MNHRKLFVGAAALLLVAAQACGENAAKATVDDSVLNAKINAALIADPGTKARQIDVEVANGIVQLNGFVESAAASRRATELAKGITGVREVHNNLQIATASRAPAVAIDDSVITTKVKAALIGERTTKAYEINVTTRDGVVELSGFVDSATAKSEAERVTRAIDGVRDIRNDLEVRGG